MPTHRLVAPATTAGPIDHNRRVLDIARAFDEAAAHLEIVDAFADVWVVDAHWRVLIVDEAVHVSYRDGHVEFDPDVLGQWTTGAPVLETLYLDYGPSADVQIDTGLVIRQEHVEFGEWTCWLKGDVPQRVVERWCSQAGLRPFTPQASSAVIDYRPRP